MRVRLISGVIAAVISLPSFVHAHDPGAHAQHHAVLIPENAKQRPQVKIEVLKDAMSGWNLHVITSNFRFAPEKVNTDNRMGEGHAHLYINGEKINRLYGPWYHLGVLPAGKHEIRVDITANNHAPYVYKGKPVQDIAVIDVSH